MSHTDDSELTKLLTDKEAGKQYNFSHRTFQKWRSVGGGPPFVRISARCIRYRPCDIEKWIEDRVSTSTSDLGDDV